MKSILAEGCGTRRGLRFAAVAVAAPVLCMACSAREGAPREAAYVDSAGVSVLDVNAPLYGEARLSRRPRLEVPGRSDDDYFMEVGAALFTADDLLVVADRGLRAIRAYSGDGEKAWEFGRRGDGPGEFQDLRGLFHGPQGSVIAYDRRLARLTAIGSGGDLLATYALEVPDRGPPGTLALFSDTLLGGLVGSGSRSVEVGLTRPTVPVMGWRLDGTALGEIAQVKGMEILQDADGGFGRLPFGPATVPAPCGEWLCIAEGEALGLVAFDGSGALVSAARVSSYDLTLTADDLREEIDLIVERWGAAEGGDPESVRRRYLDMPRRPTRASFALLRPGTDGSVWFGQNRGDPRIRPPRLWEALSPDEGWLVTLSTPEGFSPLLFGTDFVVGVSRDRYDVQSVAVYDMEVAR